MVWRYVLDNPLAWSGELAEMLFLWLQTLGAVIALGQGEHMRMTIYVSRLSPRVRGLLERISALTVAIFTLALIVPGYGYMEQQGAITMPTLGIPGSGKWRVSWPHSCSCS